MLHIMILLRSMIVHLKIIKLLSSIKLVCLILMLSLPVYAESEFNVNAEVTNSIEDNIFKLDSKSEQYSFVQNQDAVLRKKGGVSLRLSKSRQEFLVSFALTESSYESNSYLDNQSKNGILKWNWALKNRWKGDAGIAINQSLTDFSEQEDLLKNELTTNKAFFNGEFMVNSGIDIGFNYSVSERLNGSSDKEYLDRKEEKYSTNISYKVSEFIVLDADYVYLNSQSISSKLIIEEYDYSQSNLSFKTTLSYSPKTNIILQLGNVDRKGGSTKSGFTNNFYSMAVDWSVTPKTKITGRAFSTVLAPVSELSTYTLDKGLEINGQFKVFTKVVAWLGFAKSQRESDQIDRDGVINDKLLTSKLGLVYRIKPYMAVNVNYQNQSRASEREFYDYDASSFQIGVNVQL